MPVTAMVNICGIQRLPVEWHAALAIRKYPGYYLCIAHFPDKKWRRPEAPPKVFLCLFRLRTKMLTFVLSHGYISKHNKRRQVELQQTGSNFLELFFTYSIFISEME